MLFNSIDQMMLGVMTGTAQVAVFNASSKINNLIEVPISTVASIVFPQTSLKASENDHEGVKRMYEKSVTILLAMILPVLVVVAIIPAYILSWIAGAAYAEYAGVLMVILLFSVFQPFSRQFGTVMDALGKPHVNFYCITGAAFINLSLSYVFIPIWGIYGAAFATLIALVLSVVLNLWLLQLLVKVQLRAILKGIPQVYVFLYLKLRWYLKPLFAKWLVL
jgi:O-antigen/teichoic acid export membrane protein